MSNHKANPIVLCVGPGSIRFLSVDQLQKLLGVKKLQSEGFELVMQGTRGPGKTQMITDLYDQFEDHRLLDGTITGSFTITEPNPAFRRFLEINQYGKLPGLNPLEVGTSYRTMVEGEWEPVHNTKPKNTYKPHSFQPAKGEAPTSCKPNPKTVAKNRAKNKAAKAARKKS